MAITVLAYIAYYQLANVLPVWIQAHADLNAGGFEIPIPWFYSIDPLVSILSVPFLFALWNRQARAGPRTPALTKIAIGSFICGSAYFVLVAGICVLAGPSSVGLAGPVLRRPGRRFHVFLADLAGAGFACAPPKINATMMGVCSSPCSSPTT